MHPILFYVGKTPVATYGILVTLGYVAGTLYLWSQRERMGMTFWQFWLLCYTILAGAIVGAKAGFLLVEHERFLRDPAFFVRHWRTGWVFWSGFVGTMAAGWTYQQVFNAYFRPRKRYLPPADYFGVALPLGHSIGRLGCFAAGCCHGRPTTLPWGVRFTDPASSVSAWLVGVPLHPVQLYESAGEIAISLFLLRWAMPRIRDGRLRQGTAFFGYIGLYSVLRFLTEMFRGDERGAFLWPVLSPSQWWSIGGLLIAAAALWANGVRGRAEDPRSLFLDEPARGRAVEAAAGI